MAEPLVHQVIDAAYVDEPMFTKPPYRDFIPDGDPDEGYYTAMGAGSGGFRDFIPEGQTAAGNADPEPVPDRVNREPRRQRKGEHPAQAVRGKYAHLKVSTEEFLREKREEAAAEELIGHGHSRANAEAALAAVEASVAQQMLPGKVRGDGV